MVSFTLNGSDVSVDGGHPHLLAALREELGVCSPKDGCSPSGQCGCCTVLVDGKAVVSCNLSLEKIAGAQITTLEGLPEEQRDRLGCAFAATGALQCGFCTPGILVRVASLLDRKGADLDRETAARHLGAHLCRCTGYVKILDAVEMLARGEERELEPLGGLGTSGTRYQGFDLALGEKPYVDDLRPEGLLHGAVRLSDHARADVLRIDTSAAAVVPGVVRVFTAADVPGALRVGLIHKDWPVFIPEGGRTSYLGDVLAFVVASDRATARHAATLVQIEYDVLRPLTDAVAALDDDEDAVWELDGNVLSRSAYARGDVDADADAALASSAHVVHEIFQTQRIEHAFLEPESTLVAPDPAGRLRMYSGGQGAWDDRDQVASVLGIDPQRIVCELVSNGGAFGGKEDMANQAQTALAAFVLGAPVKCTLSREESLFIHPKRHPVRIDLTVGCDAGGRLTALRARMVGDSGPYASVGMKVLERAAGHASGPYQLPVIDVEAFAVRTNNSVCGAFRGFGANQAQFAMEGAIDRLAERVGISGWEMRARNVIEPGEVWGPGQVMDDGCRGARRCLDAVKPAYDAARAAGRAVGVGLGLKNSGLGNGFLEIVRAVVRFESDGTVEVRHCWTEMGQGVHTVAAQVAIEELGVDPARVRVIVDTTRELGVGQTTGSRGTLMGAGAVADACRKARADGCRTGVDYEGEYRVDWTSSIESGVEQPVIHSAFGYAAQLVIVDRETGAIERVVAAHDVGRAVNPMQCAGQVEGAVHMGLGYALSEDFPCDETGRPTLMTLRGLGIIRAKDVPPIEVILIEEPQPRAPYGIKGVGEIGLVPTAGAVAAALHDLDGEWRAVLPMRGTNPVTATTPGLVRAHTHLYSALARGMPAPPRMPRDFPEILELVWWRVDRALDLEMIRWGAMLGALEALESGTTAIVDHHSSPNAIEGSLDVIAAACAEVGVRTRCCYEVTDRNGAEGAKAALAENERYLRAGGAGYVGAHASFTLSDETLDAVCGLASDLGAGVHVHVAEDPVDAAAEARLTGRADESWLLAHAVHLREPLPGTIVHNPRSNLNNAVGYGRPARFPRVALGTDGIGADMLEEFRLAFALARADDVSTTPDSVWRWLQAGADLVPEVRADRVTWSYAPMDPWHLAYTPGVRPRRIEIDGDTVLDEQGPTRVDAAEVRARAAEQATRLHRRLAEL